MLTEDIRAKVEYSATENGMAEDSAEECQNDVYDRRKVALAYDNMRVRILPSRNRFLQLLEVIIFII